MSSDNLSKSELTLAALALVSVVLSGCSPAYSVSSNKPEPEYTITMSELQSVHDEAFDEGVASMAVAIRLNPNIANMNGAEQVAEAHRVWKMETNAIQTQLNHPSTK